MKLLKLKEVPNGEVFKIADYEFIKFGEENGVATVVNKNCLFNSPFGESNDLRASEIMSRLTREVLPNILNILGDDNVLEFETNLLSLDGSAIYGVMWSKVSLPTFDFYRKNRAIFEKYKLEQWWWLATAHFTEEYVDAGGSVCISPSGSIDYDFYYADYGVRPIWNLVSDVLVSIED